MVRITPVRHRTRVITVTSCGRQITLSTLQRSTGHFQRLKPDNVYHLYGFPVRIAAT